MSMFSISGGTDAFEGHPVSTPARWPGQLVTALARMSQTDHPVDRSAARAEVWTLLGLGLLRSLRQQCRLHRRLSPEDLEDLAAAKALDLMARLESGAWDPSGWDQRRLLGLLNATARNGRIDLMRRADRRLRLDSSNRNEEVDTFSQMEWDAGDPARASDRAEQREFADALVHCALELSEKSRRAWFLRVFYGLSTREIAVHPGVRLREGHVDVLLQRARRSIRRGIIQRGFDPTEMPAGTFVTLWEKLQAEGW